MLRFSLVQRPDQLFGRTGLTLALIFAVALAMISGCINTRESKRQPDPTNVAAPHPYGWIEDEEKPVTPPANAKSNAVSEFIGLSEYAARELADLQNRQFQVGARDGHNFALIANLVSRRITVFVRDGVVIDAKIEGEYPSR